MSLQQQHQEIESISKFPQPGQHSTLSPVTQKSPNKLRFNNILTLRSFALCQDSRNIQGHSLIGYPAAEDNLSLAPRSSSSLSTAKMVIQQARKPPPRQPPLLLHSTKALAKHTAASGKVKLRLAKILSSDQTWEREITGPVLPQNPNPMMRIDPIPEILSIQTTNPLELHGLLHLAFGLRWMHHLSHQNLPLHYHQTGKGSHPQIYGRMLAIQEWIAIPPGSSFRWCPRLQDDRRTEEGYRTRQINEAKCDGEEGEIQARIAGEAKDAEEITTQEAKTEDSTPDREGDLRGNAQVISSSTEERIEEFAREDSAKETRNLKGLSQEPIPDNGPPL
ncbi:hypothetical protein HOY82DRAFT_596040 [Tuber indicum]|nr:hypothetical protein HOY82DRAFT_596040 [Tuber indicum]